MDKCTRGTKWTGFHSPLPGRLSDRLRRGVKTPSSVKGHMAGSHFTLGAVISYFKNACLSSKFNYKPCLGKNRM